MRARPPTVGALVRSADDQPGGRVRSRADRLWIAYLAVGALAAGVYLFGPVLQGNGPLLTVISGTSAVAILAGIRIHRPAAAWAWRWFAIGQALFALGDAYTYSYPALIGHEVPFPSPGDALYLLVYPALMTGVLLGARRRSPHGDRAGVLDAVIIAVGVALLSWIFLMESYVHDTTLSPLAKFVSIDYPLGDVLLLAAALRIAFDGGRRSRSFFLLAGAIGALLTTDAAYGYALLDGTYHHQPVYDAGWLAYYVLWGAAALHPSMRTFFEATPDRARRLTPRRLAMLTIAALVAPAIEFFRLERRGDFDLLLIVGASIVAFMLVIARVVGLVNQNERALARERALRAANLALVEAATPDEIAAVAFHTTGLLLAGAGEARLCRVRSEGLVLVTGAGAASDVLPSWTIALLEEAAATPQRRVELPAGAHGDLELPPSATHVNVFALTAREGRRGLLVAAGWAPFSPILIDALAALCASVSLALESAALAGTAYRRANEARFASLIQNASDLITVVDRAGIVSYQSPSVERILGLAALEVAGTPFANLLVPSDRARIGRLLGTMQAGGAQSLSFECTLIHSDGRMVKAEVVATDLTGDEHVRGIVLNGRDASERAVYEQRLTHQAFHDAITGLPNRTLFTDRVEHALAFAAREHNRTAVIFLDLDDFKTINDSLGHAVGDEVLKRVAWLLLDAVQKTDTVARFGGDEFAILLEDADPLVAADLAQRLVRGFQIPLSVGETTMLVSPSIGIAVSGDGGEREQIDAGTLIRNADAAMYMCKREGKGGYRLFEAAMHEHALERFELRGELQRAIASDELELHYQPVVRLGDGRVTGAEALVRWRHPTRGLLQPGQFVALAEEMGLIVDLGRWVLRESCRQAVELQAAGEVDAEFIVGVNLSVVQLQHPDVIADVRAVLGATGIDPAALVLEITETVMMADYGLAGARLQQLKDLGVGIAMDDFGTGYSSLGYLSHLPVDVLKMDRSFLASNANPAASGLAGAVIGLGRSLGLLVVAEGIESLEQYEALRALGCDLGQGFFIGRPMELATLREWLAEQGRARLAAA
jgi:diguanylate cyclase (GGDEF)-like protein/PAS domain S-box-containing protein